MWMCTFLTYFSRTLYSWGILLFKVERMNLLLLYSLSLRINEIVVGGTKQHGNFSEVLSPDDTAHILNVTSQLVPSIKVKHTATL